MNSGKTIDRRFIVIEGNIGVGKTSLVNMLCADFNARSILERFEDNAFLPKFYQDPDRYSFPLELSFLADRYNQLKSELSQPDLFQQLMIADYYFMKSFIFASCTLPPDELKLYSQLFHIISQQVPKPDLYVYLHVPVERLQENIHKRGRQYEQSIADNYLQTIQQAYFNFFKQQTHLKILVLDINNMDYVNNSTDYQLLKEKIMFEDYSYGINRIIF